MSIINKKSPKETVYVPEGKLQIQLESITVVEKIVNVEKPVYINKEFDLKKEILAVLKPAIESAIAEIITNSVIEIPAIKPRFGKVNE